MPPLVLERHRPTLRELVAPLPRRARRALAALAALVVVAIVVLALGAEGRGPQFVHRVAPEFNFAYGSVLKRERPQDGEYVRLVRRRGDVFVQSFAVEPLRLPAYDGDVGGILPIVADARIAELRRRHPGFELVLEGKTRINKVPGYTIAYRARLGDRRLFGRDTLLVEPGRRAGVTLSMLATYAAGVARPEDVGARGVVKRPYRSFRFGTETP